MIWQKQGLVYCPKKELYWQKSHAALPTLFNITGSLYRVFFSSRDKNNFAHIGWFEIDLKNPSKILNTSKNPVLSPGAPGFFDDCGVQACSIVNIGDGSIYMYYLGWNVGAKGIFYTSIGLAISNDDGNTFKKFSDAPILQRSKYDPWMVSGGTVILNNDIWIMYYLSGFRLEKNINGSMSSWYDIKIAKSNDGINWNREGKVALALQNGETNISRPTLCKYKNEWLCWFPFKSQNEGYRCGFAKSINCIDWIREDSNGLQPSIEGWDSKAIDKMDVVIYNDKYYMFYNGNNFGEDGIGLAIGFK